MNRLVSALGLVLFVTSLISVESTLAARSDKDANNLRGPVLTVVEHVYTLINRFGQWTPELKSTTTTTYRRDGNITEEVSKWPDYTDPLHTYTRICNYDDQSRQVDYSIYDISGAVYRRGEMTRRNGRRVNSVYTAKGVLKYKEIIEFDEDSCPIVIDNYDPDGSLSSRSVFSYDSDGRQIGWKFYDDKGSIMSDVTFLYNNEGNLVQEKSVAYILAKSVTIEGFGDFEFDEFENWVKRIRYEWVTKFGKSYWEPKNLCERTISYFQ